MADKEGWPTTPEEYIAWDRDMHATRAVTDTVLYEFLTWLKDQGFEVCDGPDHNDGWPITDASSLRQLCKIWVKEKYG